MFLFFFIWLDGGKTLTYFNYDYSGDFQTATFEGPEVRKIFYGSFHKVSMPWIHIFFILFAMGKAAERYKKKIPQALDLKLQLK